MSIETLFRFIHSWNRWLLVAVAVVAVLYFAWGWLQGQAWTKRGQTLLTAFSSLIGVQWILGVILLISLADVTGLSVRHYWEHLTVQTIALGVAHMHMGWRKKDFDDKTRYKRGLLLIIGVLLLIVIGIMILPEAMQWRMMSLDTLDT